MVIARRFFSYLLLIFSTQRGRTERGANQGDMREIREKLNKFKMRGIIRTGMAGWRICPFFSLGVLLLVGLQAGSVSESVRTNSANWQQLEKFSAEKLRPLTYTTSVTPGWINNTDRFWYRFQYHDGVNFYVVDPDKKTKEPLFDTDKMAALLSEVIKKPYDRTNFPITTITFNQDGKSIRFTIDNIRYEYNLETERLRSLGRAPQQQQPQRQDFRNMSPDRKSYVFAMDHNLYYVDMEDEKNPIQLTKDGERFYSFGAATEAQVQQRQRERERREEQEEEQQEQQEQQEQSDETARRVRPNVTWSRDSKAFYVTRTDSRKVKDLFLVNSLSEPRPTLTTYKYSMPGEEEIPLSELHIFIREEKELKKANIDKWKFQSVTNLHWAKGSEKLRFNRRDRLMRNMEFCEMDVATGEIKVLISESVNNAFLERQEVRYVKQDGDFIWWSERTGYGHYYLYSNDGKLKNAITSGPWRAHSIVALDSDKGVLWIHGYGREKGENPYYRHLYRVNLDGTGLTLLDEGNAENNSVLSPTRKYVVQSSSRVDMATKNMLRDANGKLIMDLGEADLSALYEYGWKMPETFSVKAADGVTNLYGNMWKPYDFDETKKYPIIVHVYPGPQTDGVTTTFSVSSVNQRLAQLGFIVIQLGNRGGSPLRSNVYHSHGYFNLRDYALADTKYGIEQLAAKHSWIDVDKVGIYGHSGGGFMTAAALLQPPYNEFFKVGVSSAGNHDNNVYNHNWSEQHHGLQEVFDLSAEDFKKFEIKVPANHELAENLKGKLLLVHGDMDNNVHPAGTIRLVNALIRANKRFDFLLLPGQAHGFGNMTNYFNDLTFEYFAEHLLGDYYRGNANMKERR